jgi:hypothetical protein
MQATRKGCTGNDANLHDVSDGEQEESVQDKVTKDFNDGTHRCKKLFTKTAR